MLLFQRHYTYDRQSLKPLLRDVLSSFERFRTPAAGCQRVLLKPNFVVPVARGDASVTHPDFYMTLADILLERGFEVGIGESPAFGSCEKAVRAHGVHAECVDRGIEIVEFRQPEAFEGVAGDRHYAELSVAAELNQWDAVINVPKLKTHQQFTFTAATKNLYGCVTGKRKFVRHNLCANDPVRFARMIIANAAQVRCEAHIADGITAMHVRGPRGGKPYPLGVVVASDSFLDLDWVFCRLTGLEPESTPLFSALNDDEREAISERSREVLQGAEFASAEADAIGFRHAPLIHISFSPWHIVRSGLRTVRYTFSGQ